MIFAWLGSTMYTVVFILACEKYHTGRDMWDIPLTYYEGMARVTWIAELAVLVCSGCCKISVLLFYRRLVGGTYNRYWLIAVFVAIGFTAAWAIAFIIMLFINCSPMEAYWKVSIMTGCLFASCWGLTNVYTRLLIRRTQETSAVWTLRRSICYQESLPALPTCK